MVTDPHFQSGWAIHRHRRYTVTAADVKVPEGDPAALSRRFLHGGAIIDDFDNRRCGVSLDICIRTVLQPSAQTSIRSF